MSNTNNNSQNSQDFFSIPPQSSILQTLSSCDEVQLLTLEYIRTKKR